LFNGSAKHPSFKKIFDQIAFHREIAVVGSRSTSDYN
jgi:hypothetical protein